LLLFFLTSVTAVSATLIPVAYYFHRTTLTGLLSNFIIVPLLGYGAVIIGFSALPFIHLFPPVAKLLLFAAAFMVKISNWIIGYLAKLPMLPIFNPNQFELSIFYLFLVSLTFIKDVKKRRGFCLSLAILFAVSITVKNLPDRGKLALTFFSIGQGESILISFPEGKNMLIDGGGKQGEGGWDVGERLLAPALWKMGVDSIDYLVMSHPHPDHIQGLLYVVENFRIGEFWEGRSYPEIEEYVELMKIIKRKKIPIRDLNGSTHPFYIGSARIEPLAPFTETIATDYLEVNDQSLVFRMKSGSFSALFTGDIGDKTESALARRPESLRCTLLKVPHHGSRYSSSMEFLKAASPQYAVVSVGYGNRYNFPSEETLCRLKAVGTRLYRTDLDGTIQVIYDKMKNNAVNIGKMGHFR
jgi:competence protein ComEC